ncbi:MAG: hypothetical protein R3C40_05955 [Parvularculaceae bacterium]
MKSNAPWSVKGIERDARETAKEAARREGMTVGEWLNQTIYTAGDPDAPSSDGQEIEGLKLRDLASAIEHLSRRAASAEARSADAVENLARSLGGVVERVQRLERTKPVDAEGAQDLSSRVKALEEKSQDRQRIEALRALEKAVSQVALQFNTAHQSAVTRIDSNEKQLQELASRIEARGDGSADAVGHLQDAIEGMAARITRAERIAAEASKLREEAGESFDADFVEKTGARLRVLGDEIKRGGDQMRGLEASIARLSGQIDAAERRSSEGVQKVSETIAELRERFASADNSEIEAAVSAVNQRTEDRIASLQQSFDDIVNRLEAAGGGQSRSVEAAATPHIEADVETGADELEDAHADDDDPFASIDLDEIETAELGEPQADAPHTDTPAADPATDDMAAGDDDDFESAFEDDFDFDFDEDKDDEGSNAGSDSSVSAEAGDDVDDEAKSALADVREAFGLDNEAPARKATSAQFDDFDDLAFEENGQDAATSGVAIAGDIDDEDDMPPPVFGRKAAPAEIADEYDASPAELADGDAADYEDGNYLKAARRAARDAAEKAAAEDAHGAKRRKLTPKQRAILAARVKRRKLEEQRAKEQAEAEAVAADTLEYPDSDPDSHEDDRKSSVKARIMAAISKVKSRKSADKDKDKDDDDDSARGNADAASKAAKEALGAQPSLDEKGNPNLAAHASGLVKTLKANPLLGGIVGLVIPILLLGAALFVMTKDIVFRNDAPTAQQQTPAAAGEAATPATGADQATLRPRDLYLESFAALRAAQTDAQEQAALKGIEQAAALGHPPAQLQLGELYKIGQGYPKDLSKARQWYERAASGGNVLAMHRLGVMTARGEGGPVDPAGSISWFEQAANFGLLDSQYNLGATFHPTGEENANAIQDRAKAYFWYSLAADNGDAQAGELAAGLAEALPADEKAALDAEIAAWTQQTPDAAANENAPEAAAE